MCYVLHGTVSGRSGNLLKANCCNLSRQLTRSVSVGVHVAIMHVIMQSRVLAGVSMCAQVCIGMRVCVFWCV